MASFSPRSVTRTARTGPSGGVSSPNRLMSALLNGRSHANALPATNQVRLPCRSPTVTSGRSVAIRAASSTVAIPVRYAADLDYRLTVLADGCLDADPEVHQALLHKVFPRQAEVTTIADWAAGLSAS